MTFVAVGTTWDSEDYRHEAMFIELMASVIQVH